MQKQGRTQLSVVVSLFVLTTAAGQVVEERPFGATDPYRPYDQRPIVPSDTTPYHEGLYLNADLGISLPKDTSSIKADPGFRFSIGPGYTMHNEPAYEVGAQFETGFIYNPVRSDLVTTTFLPGSITPTTTTQRRSANLFQVPFLVDFVYTFHVEPNFLPYLGIGGGGVYRAIGTSTLGSNHSTDPAFQVMAGLRFQLNEQHEIGFGYKFLDAFSSGSDLISHSLSVAWVFHF